MDLLQPYHTYAQLEAGCDEAGRGCMAGPVFAAAVILPKNFYHPLLNDSKKVAAQNRLVLKHIIEANAVTYAVASVSEAEIDTINILQASIKAMHLALAQLQQNPEFIIVDGNKFNPYKNIPYATVVDGDANYTSIAAASILAKTHRDAYMQQIHLEFPEYGWLSNKGYGTAKHKLAIEQYGLTKYHRKTFNFKPKQISLW
jgi:ribonuclease HII